MSIFSFGKQKQALSPPTHVTDSRYKILGTGCPNCDVLDRNIVQALEELGIDDGLQKISDITKIAAYGVMSVPAFVVDDKVLSVGKVLSVAEIKRLIQGG